METVEVIAEIVSIVDTSSIYGSIISQSSVSPCHPPDTCLMMNIVDTSSFSIVDTSVVSAVKKSPYPCYPIVDTCSYSITEIPSGIYYVVLVEYDSLYIASGGSLGSNRIIGRHMDPTDSTEMKIIELNTSTPIAHNVDIYIE